MLSVPTEMPLGFLKYPLPLSPNQNSIWASACISVSQIAILFLISNKCLMPLLLAVYCLVNNSPYLSLRCAVFLGTRCGFLRQLGMCGGQGRTALAGCDQGQCPLPQLAEWHSAASAHTWQEVKPQLPNPPSPAPQVT